MSEQDTTNPKENEYYVRDVAYLIKPDLASTSWIAIQREMVADLKEQVSLGRGTKSKLYVRTKSELEIVSGWLKSRLSRVTTRGRPAGVKNGDGKNVTRHPVALKGQSIAQIEQAKPPAKADPLQIAPTKAGLKRLINVMRQRGYIIECSVTEPLEEL